MPAHNANKWGQRRANGLPPGPEDWPLETTRTVSATCGGCANEPNLPLGVSDHKETHMDTTDRDLPPEVNPLLTQTERVGARLERLVAHWETQAELARRWWASVADHGERELDRLALVGWEREQAERVIAAAHRAAQRRQPNTGDEPQGDIGEQEQRFWETLAATAHVALDERRDDMAPDAIDRCESMAGYLDTAAGTSSAERPAISLDEQEMRDDREHRFWGSMARHARAEHQREPLVGSSYGRYVRVVRACDRASFVRMADAA